MQILEEEEKFKKKKTNCKMHIRFALILCATTKCYSLKYANFHKAYTICNNNYKIVDDVQLM